jgi:hypothetical protein
MDGTGDQSTTKARPGKTVDGDPNAEGDHIANADESASSVVA